MYSNELIVNILQYIDNHINDKISINDFVNNYNYNRYYIMKLFKKELGISIIEYINIIKVYNSLKYINSNSLLSIALDNGFYSLEYYSETFKRVFGVSPNTYKKILNNNSDETDIFIKNFSYIKSIINKTNHYKINIKPTESKKTLSIFNN